ncbi:3-dehydroquinate synthase [Berryella wangjianweii]|uniref:3-dehydroquinate synthase n=1 Tax=Berryella wangjianweii TaxID=2734634 RepID=A0A6M8J3E7_9ACTN|nr:3-dehydroquinate synthase [Berryella wangjianweii]NPD31714.1 3-dehydroquinate synthase [Eggerthellaceae bacterium zg-997]QKF07681.1 3-dehydroquinate synthase [Berryella wangjianweii]
MATSVMISLPGTEVASYAVRVRTGGLDRLGDLMAAVPACAPPRRAVVITDHTVADLYLGRVRDALRQAGYRVSSLAVASGEASKSLAVAGDLWGALAERGVGRDCVVVALGGGVVGDLAGFVACGYQRGVPVVQVPTTLLAMVDSSVGGKVGVNLPAGKNLVGGFLQPQLVCADPAVLETLPAREWACGFAEVVKAAAVCGDDFFFWLLDHVAQLAAHDFATVEEAIARSVVLKADVVATDVAETADLRVCLNYGHTLGHALEHAVGWGGLSHGHAVAEGIRFAAFAAERLRGVAPDLGEALGGVLDALGLPPLSELPSRDRVLDAMACDKKARAGQARLVLLDDVGRWAIQPVSADQLRDLVGAWWRERGA